LPRRVGAGHKAKLNKEGSHVTETLKDKKVAILAADMFERVELEEPRKALEDAGASVEIVSLEDGDIQGFDHFEPANSVKVDRTVEEASPDDYDALMVPGGVGNPDLLRGDENAVAFVRAFHDAGKPMAVICHGPWVLVESGVVRGKRVTSWPTLETDIRNAGGDWVDEEVVVDGNLVTSRKPDDIPAFNREMTRLFSGEKVPA
jgi:protease I